MIRKLLLLLPACLLLAAPAFAEDAPETLAGVYDGHQTEIGAALELGADGRFQYYLSYGALDEMAAGTWAATGDGIVLDSDPVTAPAFALLDSKGGKGSSFDIVLEVPGRMPVQFFSAVALFSNGSGRQQDFEENRLRFQLAKDEVVTGLVLLFPIYAVSSDKIAVPPKTGSMHFRFDPNDLGTVDFDHQPLRREGNAFLLERYDRTLRFRKEEPEAPADASDPVDAPDPVEPIDQFVGDWSYTGQDCDTDNYFDPPADMPGARFSLSSDHTYRLTRLGKETQGAFTLVPSEYFNGELWIAVLEQAGLTFILNIDRLESWSEGAVATQCTQLFERPE